MLGRWASLWAGRSVSNENIGRRHILRLRFEYGSLIAPKSALTPTSGRTYTQEGAGYAYPLLLYPGKNGHLSSWTDREKFPAYTECRNLKTKSKPSTPMCFNMTQYKTVWFKTIAFDRRHSSVTVVRADGPHTYLLLSEPANLFEKTLLIPPPYPSVSIHANHTYIDVCFRTETLSLGDDSGATNCFFIRMHPIGFSVKTPDQIHGCFFLRSAPKIIKQSCIWSCVFTDGRHILVNRRRVSGLSTRCITARSS